MRPERRLIKSSRDAEEVAAAWLQWMGFHDAVCTGAGKDAGVDVLGQSVAAQVKAEARASTGPVLQRLQGAAAAHGPVETAFFSLAGYTADAKVFADKVGMALFEFDLQGEPSPANECAAQWMESAEAQPDMTEDSSWCDGGAVYDESDPSNHTLFQDYTDLPFGYALGFGEHSDRLPDKMRPLDWPLDPQTGEYPSALEVAESWPFDPTTWDWLEFGDHEAIREAIDFLLRLEPRPRMLFGGLVNAVGWTWLVGELPSRLPLRLFIIEVAPLPAEGQPFDLSYGMTPPTLGYCTSLQAALAFTRPWREASAWDERVKLVANAREGEAKEYRYTHDNLKAFPLRRNNGLNMSNIYDSLAELGAAFGQGADTIADALAAAAAEETSWSPQKPSAL